MKRYLLAIVRFRTVSALTISLIGALSSAKAEVVLLKTGETISGRIVGQSPTAIHISTPGGTKTLAKAALVKIQYVPFTPEEKSRYLEAARQKQQAQYAEMERIRKAQLEEQDRKRQLAELEAKARAEKEKEAKERAERAAALRELVEKGQMEKPAGEPISYWDFALRSLVLPGWGHYYLERPVFGTIYAVGAVAFLGAAYETRRRGLNATKENHREVRQNFLLSIQPALASLEMRTAYTYYANARAFVTYQKKIDEYHGALYSLAVFYGVQLLHIIYNGIAWENGLLIVRSTESSDLQITPQVALLPDFPAAGKPGVGAAVHAGLSVRF